MEIYTKILTLGSNYTNNALKGEVIIQEKVDGCVSVYSKILKSDLSYVYAGQLKVGDKLLAFDEVPNKQKLKEAIVTHATPIYKPCIEVSTSKRKIIVSKDHPFLVHGKRWNGLTKHWKIAEDLEVGDNIVSLGTWEHDGSWEGGYIAGQLDGEGCLTKSSKAKDYSKYLGYYQSTNAGLHKIKKILNNKQFSFNETKHRHKKKWKWVTCLYVNKLPNILKMLGTFRPQRLLLKAPSIWKGAPLNSIKSEKVVSLTPIGRQRVMGLSTSTKTYIADGLFSHNSQFRWGIEQDGKLFIASHKVVIAHQDENKMFKKGFEYIMSMEDLIRKEYGPNTYFYAEYLQKPKHNTLSYERVPKNNIVLFDVLQEGRWLTREELQEVASKLDIDLIPELYKGTIEVKRIDTGMGGYKSSAVDFLKRITETTPSYLGKELIEGVVIKNYNEHISLGGKIFPLFTKYVREVFKERHAIDWKIRSPKASMQDYIAAFKCEARWDKAVIHLKEKGTLENAPKDIGALMKEVKRDIIEEEKENIKNELYKRFKDDILRVAIQGLPEWYKEKLIKDNIK